MEMRSQDQALIRQLMELHSGIQELKQELSEEEQEEETDEEEEEGSYWDSESERGSGSIYCGSAEVGFFVSFLKMPPLLSSGVLSRKTFSRRSSVPWNFKLPEEIQLVRPLLSLSSKTATKDKVEQDELVLRFPTVNSLPCLHFQEMQKNRKTGKHVKT